MLVINRKGYCGWCKHREPEHGENENCEGCWKTQDKKQWKLHICQVPRCTNVIFINGVCVKHDIKENNNAKGSRSS